MRPISLARLINIAEYASRLPVISKELVSKEFETTIQRASELLLECTRVGILSQNEDVFAANRNTKAILEAFEQEDWGSLRIYFSKNYSFFRNYLGLVSSWANQPKGLSKEEAMIRAAQLRLALNRTALDVLTDWSERLGVVQRHLYERRFYKVLDRPMGLKKFVGAFGACYSELNIKSGLTLSLSFVEIPRLREDVCERLKLSREAFDAYFLRLLARHVGKVEVSGAPAVTVAKKSPLSIRKLEPRHKQDILEPHLDLSKERAGIEIAGRSYYYVAIHDRFSEP
jgi:hypothetical protein